MRSSHALLLAVLIPTLAACGGGGGGDDGIVPEGPLVATADFLHVTTAATVQNWWSVIDHPATNGNPDAKLFVTHNWNPGGGVGTYHETPVGVRYDEISGRWQISRQGGGSMPTGLSFNVTVLSGLPSAFTHVTTAANSQLDLTRLDHPSLDGAPAARALVTKNLTPTDRISESNITPVGVWYEGPSWVIFMQDASIPMDENFKYNVHVLPDDASSFVLTANAGNTTGNWTAISHPDSDGNPNAHVQVAQGYGGGGIRNNREVGVFYNELLNQWAVFNEDNTAMPLGAVFHVRVRP